jgi:hypothetical protein
MPRTWTFRQVHGFAYADPMKKPTDTPTAEKPKADAPRRKRVHPLGMAIASVVRPLVGKKGFVDVDILARWSEIVGAEVAANALPLRISKPRAGSNEGSTLHVRVGASAYAMILQHREPEICGRINGYFGFQAVTRLKIALGTLPPPKPIPPPAPPPPPLSEEDAARIGRVADPELREVLAQLGRTMAARNPETKG